MAGALKNWKQRLALISRITVTIPFELFEDKWVHPSSGGPCPSQVSMGINSFFVPLHNTYFCISIDVEL